MSRWVVLTDLDGTLLDAQDFSYAPALPALDRLRAESIPLIPVTSKTMAEVEPLAAELGLTGPVIVESGGAMASQEWGSWNVTPLGVSITEIRASVAGIEARCQAKLRLYSQMSLEEAARVSGLTGDALRRSQTRQFDEPFLLVEGDLEQIGQAAADVGLTVRQGGRLHHLCGAVTKGGAVKQLLSTWLARPGVIALGDARMDAEFLVLADVAVIIPGPDGTPNAALRAAVPHAIIAPAPGPRGWAEAILAILDKEKGVG